jgi:hypothetical protein
MKLKKLVKRYLTNNAYLALTLIKDARPDKVCMTHTYEVMDKCPEWLNFHVLQIEANDNGTLTILLMEPKNDEVH